MCIRDRYDSNTGIAIISVDKSLLDDATIRAIEVAELGNSNIVSRGASVIALEANYAILTGLVTVSYTHLPLVYRYRDPFLI